MEMEVDLDVNKAKIGFMTAGILIGIIGTIFLTGLTSNAPAASQNLVNFLENQSGQELEVVDTKKAGVFYEVSVKTSDNQLVTYYTNSDGKMYTQNMQDVEQIQAQADALMEFSSCLEDSGTVMYGNASQRETQTQIQALGGATVVEPIYKDVNNQTALREAIQNGVQRIPGFYQNGSVSQGVQTLNQVEQFTGCQYQVN